MLAIMKLVVAPFFFLLPHSLSIPSNAGMSLIAKSLKTSQLHPTIFLLTFSLLLLLQEGLGENTIKICTTDGKSYEVNGDSCLRGAWAKEQLQVECVCVNGLWVLSEKFCDDQFFIVASREDECFKINAPIRRFLSLMNNEALAARSMYYFRGNLKEFKAYVEGAVPTPMSGDPSYLLRFNDTVKSLYVRHEEGVPSNFWQRCYKPSTDPETFQLIRTDGANSFESGECDKFRDLKFGFGSNDNTVWELGMGTIWHSTYGVEKPSSRCKKSCGSPNEEVKNVDKRSTNGKSKRRAQRKVSSSETRNGNINFAVNWSHSILDNTILGYSFDEDGLSLKEEDYDENLSPSMLEADKYSTKDADVMAERLKDNGRDTIRMANYLKKWIFHNIPGPVVTVKEFKYLQYARIIFLKSCPDVDGLTLTNFMRLFRFLVYEVLRKNPQSYVTNTNDKQHQRILDTMGKCFDGVTPYSVTFEEDACVDGGESSLLKVVGIKDANGASYFPSIIANKTDEVSFKIGRRSDTVLETVWKLMLHAHYRCVEEFKEHPEDHAWMYVKLQEFITNPRIIFRWEHPGEYLNKVYAFMHPGFKLVKFAKTVDACVSAAKQSSLFEEWLQRPKKQRDFSLESVMDGSMSALGAKGGGRPTLFDGRGYCVNKFEDPLVWSNLNADIDAQC